MPTGIKAVRRLRLAGLLALGLIAATASPGAAMPDAGRPEYFEGLKYETGIGVAADPVRAFAHYCAAARAGDPAASLRVGLLFHHGLGIPADPAAAAAWLDRAAALGDPSAGRLRPTIAAAPAWNARCRPADAAAGPARDAAAVHPKAGPMPPAFAAAIPADTMALVRTLAPAYGLDPDLVAAVIRVESGARSGALSPKGAMGLMQLIPDTAARFGVGDPYDAVDNMQGGMAYLRWLLAYFAGDVQLALAGYNAGEGAVDRYGGIPPYKETTDYVRRVTAFYPLDRHAFDPTVAGTSPIVAKRSQRRDADPGLFAMRAP